MLLTIGRWLGVPGQHLLWSARDNGVGDAAPKPEGSSLAHFASHEIRRRRRRLLRGKAGLADLSAEARHRIRIDEKRLRYTVDFFSSLYSQNRTARYLKVHGKVQDLLGECNDAQVALRLLDSPDSAGTTQSLCKALGRGAPAGKNCRRRPALCRIAKNGAVLAGVSVNGAGQTQDRW